jgi:hypothetical protein
MGKKTGNPRGRPPGAKNKRTREREIALAQAADKLRETMGDTFDGDAHALMTMLYQNQSLPLELRLDAAKAAAPYERPKLSSVEHKKPPIDVSKLTDDELDQLRELYRRAGATGTGDAGDGMEPAAGAAGPGDRRTRH